jgi:hypothetical protein
MPAVSTITVQLNQSAVITLNGAGNGTAQLGPLNAREMWLPEVVSVKTNQAPGTIVNEALCKIYAGPDTSDSNFVDGTLSGSTGDSTGNASGQSVDCGEYVFAVWSGGDAGAQGRVNVTGSKVISGARISR